MKTVAERFVQAYTGHNRADLLGVLAPDVDFRGMTPGRFWEASTAEDLVDNVLFHWIDVHDVVQQVLALDRDWMADREHVSFRLSVHTPDGHHLVEQQAYLMVDDGLISWLRMMCSGFRKVD
ncbi:MAG TPA: hypothetical protein VFT68_03725 [Lapillicoccus sp.]|nr:hypothetical protein [Lapillicoccus sp.]